MEFWINSRGQDYIHDAVPLLLYPMYVPKAQHKVPAISTIPKQFEHVLDP